MDRQQLIKYLKNVIDLEVQYQTAQNAYGTCQKQLSQMGINRTYVKPEYYPPEEPHSGKGCSVLIWGGLGILVLFFIVGEAPILGIFFVPAVIWFIYSIIAGFSDDSDAKAAYQRKVQNAEETYRKQMSNYINAVRQNEAQLAFDQKHMPALRKDVQLLKERRDSAKGLLDKFYALGVLRPKYQNLPAVATFLEYLENERCFTLTGHEGCYNLFEEELQRGIIISQLINISQQLGQIRKNQEYLAYALEDIQHATTHLSECADSINGKLDLIKQDQRTQAYYAEQSANDQRRLNNYIMMRDWINS